jgi:C_GCAxxG_C_C family probable redox protein
MKRINDKKVMTVEEKKKLVRRIEKAACDNERRRKGCCRNVAAALQMYLGLGNGDVFRAAVPLGGGVARSGGTCGALLGGLMAIGLAYCEDDMNVSMTTDSYGQAMSQSIKLFNSFKDKFGCTECRDIQMNLFGRYYDLNKPDEASELGEVDRKAGYPVIATAARLSAEVILKINNAKS